MKRRHAAGCEKVECKRQVLDGKNWSCPRKDLNLILSRTSENDPLSNKMEIIFIIEPIVETKKLSPTCPCQHFRAVTTIFILGGLRSHYRRRPHHG